MQWDREVDYLTRELEFARKMAQESDALFARFLEMRNPPQDQRPLPKVLLRDVESTLPNFTCEDLA